MKKLLSLSMAMLAFACLAVDQPPVLRSGWTTTTDPTTARAALGTIAPTNQNRFTVPQRITDPTDPSTNTLTGTNISIWDGSDNKQTLDIFKLHFDTSDTHVSYGQNGASMTNSAGEIVNISPHASFLGGVVSMTNLSLVDSAAPTTNSQSGAGISIWDGGDGGVWLDENSMKFGSGGGDLNTRYGIGGIAITNHGNHEVTIATAGSYKVTQDATSTTINPVGLTATNTDTQTGSFVHQVDNDGDIGLSTTGSAYVGSALTMNGDLTVGNNTFLNGNVGVNGNLTNAGDFSLGTSDGRLNSSADVLNWTGSEIDAALFAGDGSGLQNLVGGNVTGQGVPLATATSYFSVMGFTDHNSSVQHEVDGGNLPAQWLPVGVPTNTVSASANLGFGVITALSFSEKVVALTGVVTNAPISVGLPTNYPSLMLFDARCASNNFVNLRVYNLNTLSSVAYTNWFRFTAVQ